MILKNSTLCQITEDLTAAGISADTEITVTGAEYLDGEQLRTTVLVEVLDGTDDPIFQREYPAVAIGEMPDE